MRFPCPSSSLNKRRLGDKRIVVDGEVDRGVLVRANLSCPLRLLDDVFIFPGEFLKNSTVKEHLLSAFEGEVSRLCSELIRMKKELRSFFKVDSVDDEEEPHPNIPPITLDDIFHYVDQSNYPLLRKSVFEVRSINPTTVSCEQSFSCLKHSNHVTTKIDNLCMLVDYRLSMKLTTR